MMSMEEKGHLLSPSGESIRSSEEFNEPPIEIRRKRSTPRLFVIIASLCFVLSLAINVYLGTQYAHSTDTGRSPYSGLRRDTPMIYQAHSEYWGENDTRADELWDALDIDDTTVAINDAWAASKGLPATERFPWDDDKGVFVLKGFHDLHCLKMLRHALVSLDRTKKPSVQYKHLYHCLDGLRQTVICNADDTPMRSVPGVDHTLADGQQFMCRDWERMVEWARHPDREACWRMMDDYKPIKHKLERHGFCPKGSPYYDTMTRYFELHGHKEAFFTDEASGLY